MNSRWRAASVVPCHDHWLQLKPVGPGEAIVDKFEMVKAVIV
jgi:hypothetical protein